MKKILITRKLIKESEDKASKTFDPIFRTTNDPHHPNSRYATTLHRTNSSL